MLQVATILTALLIVTGCASRSVPKVRHAAYWTISVNGVPQQRIPLSQKEQIAFVHIINSERNKLP